MAGNSKNPDIQLLFGVQGGGTLDNGSSGALIREQLSEIVKKINDNPFQIRFAADEDSLRLLREQIDNLRRTTSTGKGNSFSVFGDNHKAMFDALKKIETQKEAIQKEISKASNIGGADSERNIGVLNGLIERLNKLKAAIQTTSPQEFAKQMSNIGLLSKLASNEIAQLTRQLESQKATQDTIAIDSKEYAAALSEIDKLTDSIAKTQNKYATNKSGKLTENKEDLNRYSNKLEELNRQLKDGTLSQKTFNDEVSKVKSGVNSTISSMSNYGAVINTLKSQLSSVAGLVSMYYTTHQLITKGVNTIKDMVAQAKELDAAFADTRIVTHATAEELKSYSETISDVAQETATSINDLVSATTTYARLGYTLEESTLLAKYTGMLEKVGNIDTEKAENAITAIIKAFPDDVDIETIESAMDKLVTTGNSFPISVEQIAEGMTNASSAMAAAGNSFDETVALLTAANTTVQNASKASTALRTISARLRKTKTELDDLGESMEESTYDNLVAALTQHNVALTTIDGEYRSTFDIMKDISEHWSEMTNMEQAALAEAIAGTRQQTVFYSIVENFREATGAMEEMEHSAGSLASSYSIYTDTIEAHTTQFNTAWQKLSMDFVNSGMVKGIVDFGTSILDVADKLQRLHLLIPAIIASINAIKAAKLGVSLLTIKKNAAAFVSEITRTGTVTEVLKKRFLELSAAEQKEITTQLQVNAQQQVAGATTAKQAMETAGLTVATNAQTSANIGLANSFKAVLASNPLGWITLAASLIPSIVGWIKDLSSASDELQTNTKSLSEALSEMSNAISKYKENASKAGELIPRYAQLAQGVDQYGRNISLTDDAYKEFIDIQNQLVDIIPDLKSGIDENGDAMIAYRGSIEAVTEELQNLAEKQKEVDRGAILESAKPVLAAFQYRPIDENGLGSGLPNFVQDTFLAVQGLDLDDDTKATLNKLNNKRESMEEELHALDTLRSVLESGRYGSYDFFNRTLFNTTVLDVLDRLYDDDTMAMISDALNGDINKADTVNALIDTSIQRVKDNFYKSSEYRSLMDPIKQAMYEWLRISPEYEQMADDMQQLAIRMISVIPDEDIDGRSEEDLQKYIQDNIITPLQNASPEVQAAASSIISLSDSFRSGEIGAGEFARQLNLAKSVLEDAGIDAKSLDLILSTSDYSATIDQIESIRRSLKDSEIEAWLVDAYVSQLSYEDITIAYRILSEDGSMTIDELISAIERAKFAAEGFADVADFTGMFDKLDDVAKNLDKVTSAMEKLKKGTALTKDEMLKLAQQYPELLKQSNLFTDGSIAGQEKLLQVVVESYKTERDAVLETKIQELEATVGAIQKQLVIEQAKQELLMHMREAYAKGSLAIESDKTDEIHDLGVLEATNFVTMQNDKLSVNKASLDDISTNTRNSLNSLVTIAWQGYSNATTKALNQIGTEGTNSILTYADLAGGALIELGMDAAFSQWPFLQAAGQEAIRDEAQRRKDALAAAIGKPGIVSVNGVNLGSIGDVSKATEYSTQTSLTKKLQDSVDFVTALKKWEEELGVEIDNLKALKGMSLDEFMESIASGNSSSSSSSNSDSSGKDDAANYFDKLNDALDKFVQYRVKVIKDLHKKEQDALKNRLNELKEFYDKQKQMLRDARDEEKYLEEQSEKRKSVSTLRSQIEQLKNDNSAWAAKRTIELTEELADAEKELLDFEKDHAIDEQIDMLDSEYERIAADIQNSIDKIDESLNDPKSLYNQALAEIQSHAKNIYDEMKAYADATGNGHTNESDKLYQALVEAANAYTDSGSSVPAYINAIIAAYAVGGYASGTPSAAKGLHRIFENGAEAIFESANGNKYKLFSGGEKVLPADATNFLYKFAEFGANRFGASSNLNSRLNSITGAAPAVINLGDIIINGNADERTVSEIRRAQRENVEMMLREFNKLRH